MAFFLHIILVAIWKLEGSGDPTVNNIVVKFEDDINPTTGKVPHRRVPSRFVIRPPSTYFYDEQEDYDLVPPSSASVTTTVSIDEALITKTPDKK